MAAGITPADPWPGWVKRIQDGDPSVGAEIGAYHQRLDNYLFSPVAVPWEPVWTDENDVAVTNYTLRRGVLYRVGRQVIFYFVMVTSDDLGTGLSDFVRIPADLPIANASVVNPIPGVAFVRQLNSKVALGLMRTIGNPPTHLGLSSGQEMVAIDYSGAITPSLTGPQWTNSGRSFQGWGSYFLTSESSF